MPLGRRGRVQISSLQPLVLPFFFLMVLAIAYSGLFAPRYPPSLTYCSKYDTLFLQCPHRQGKRRQKGRSQLQCNVPLPLVEKMPPVVGEQGRGPISCPVGRKAHSSSNSVTL
ncbi:hypothetical protein QR685DRAFT_25075 [Neurospora intermedia]|uniref:Secreted protein n=1 Tax=Neurospora intermedia TaxID=5142 RepID=A0ABR3DQE1_NEUIN